MINELTFEIIQRCINNCIYCSSNSNNKSQYIVDLDTFKNVIDDALALGLKRLCISGGEPFLHPDIINIVQYAKLKNIEVFIYSCGIIENNGIISSIQDETLEFLANINLDKIIFNLQASNEELYDRITGTQNRFDLVKDSICKASKYGIYTEIHFVPMKINYKEIEPTINLARKLNVQQISFLRLVVQERAFKNRKLLMLSEQEEDKIKDDLRLIKNKYNDIKIRIGIPLTKKFEGKKCGAGWEKLIIRYDGAVLPCEAYKYIKSVNKGQEIRPDNINSARLKEIYFKSEFLNLFRHEIKKYHDENNSCEVCPAQSRIKAFLR
jgi:radical SAM protein with 4Fe4S-binding SPASM domain